MKRILLIFAGIFAISVYAQLQPSSFATFQFKYQVNGLDGYNGLSVTYNPHMDLYYCVFAGNADFPLEVFNSSGKMVMSTNAKVDMRGLWYNPKTKTLEGTKYGGGAFLMNLDNNGYPISLNYPKNGNQFSTDDIQSVTVSNGKNEIYAYNNKSITVYNKSNYKKKKQIMLKNLPTSWEYINPTSMIYLGVKNVEFGLYDAYGLKLQLFDLKGNFKTSVNIPDNAPYSEIFRFAFANNKLFLFDADSREWYAYSIFSNASGN